MLEMYRGLLALPLIAIGISCNLYCFSKYNINYAHIFHLDWNHHITYSLAFFWSSSIMTVWSISVLLCFFSEHVSFVPIPYTPLSMWAFLFGLLLFPTWGYFRGSRWWFICKLARIITAPYNHVLFEDFWIADQLCSLSIMFLDMYYVMCFLIYDQHGSNICKSVQNGIRPVILALPLWCRLMQVMLGIVNWHSSSINVYFASFT